MIITGFPTRGAVDPSEQRVAQLLGAADAGWALSTYFQRAAQSGVPIKMPLPASALTLRRDLGYSTGSAGGYLVGTQTTGCASFIEGYDPLTDAQVMSGLSAPITIPRVGTMPSHNWVAEGATITESQPAFGQLALSPKWLTILIELSRQLSLQSNEAGPVILAAIAEQFRLALIAAMLGGSGVSGEPMGLAGTTGVNAVSGTSLGASGARDMAEGILNAGGRLDRIRWFGTPAVWKLLASREFSTGSGRPVWDKDGILGQPAVPVSQAPASKLIAADMGRVVIAIFDGLGASLSVDPYSNFRTGSVLYRLMIGVDVGVLTPTAVSVASSVT